MGWEVLLGIVQVLTLHAAILPPPWADPSRNPCATQPGGWLFLFWPKDGKCYRIFQRGHPCPESMELSPVQDSSNRMIAECRCPPRTAQNSSTGACHPIFTQGPCGRGQYFAPVQTNNTRKRRGRCLPAEQCQPDEVFWAATGHCLPQFSRGPCPVGQLLVLNEDTQLGECQCSSDGTLGKYYWSPTKTCHQYYTKGPCLEKGTLFLPGPTCGCHEILPNYYSETEQCYEIGGLGPCKPGHRFHLDTKTMKASCVCKPEHVPWPDGQCYRLYTRGPCGPKEIIYNNTTCGEIPCPKGTLYFPEDKACYHVGVRGPCPRGQLVLFEQSVRPSLEGISYRGMCGCSGQGTCKEPPRGRQKNKGSRRDQPVPTEGTEKVIETPKDKGPQPELDEESKLKQKESQSERQLTRTTKLQKGQEPQTDSETQKEAETQRSQPMQRAVNTHKSHKCQSQNDLEDLEIESQTAVNLQRTAAPEIKETIAQKEKKQTSFPAVKNQESQKETGLENQSENPTESQNQTEAEGTTEAQSESESQNDTNPESESALITPTNDPDLEKTTDHQESEKEELESSAMERTSNQNDVEENKSSLTFSSDTHYYHKESEKIQICEKDEDPDSNDCYVLYSEGPCLKGEWLVPARQGRKARQTHRFRSTNVGTELFEEGRFKLIGRCDCRPGFTKSKDGSGCRLPLVALAKFLNGEDLFR